MFVNNLQQLSFVAHFIKLENSRFRSNSKHRQDAKWLSSPLAFLLYLHQVASCLCLLMEWGSWANATSTWGNNSLVRITEPLTNWRGVRTRDVVYLGWPMAPSYMSLNAGGGGGLSQWVQLYTWIPNKLWDLTQQNKFNLWDKGAWLQFGGPFIEIILIGVDGVGWGGGVGEGTNTWVHTVGGQSS